MYAEETSTSTGAVGFSIWRYKLSGSEDGAAAMRCDAIRYDEVVDD